MKAVLVNESLHVNGNTARALEEVALTLRADGLETEIVQIDAKPVRGCIACRKCAELGRCVFSDDCANEILEKAYAVDTLVLGTPVYYAQPNGAFLAVMQRVFFASGGRLYGKPAAFVAVCCRGGASTAFQIEPVLRHRRHARRRLAVLEHRGAAPGEVAQDAEGVCRRCGFSDTTSRGWRRALRWRTLPHASHGR